MVARCCLLIMLAASRGIWRVLEQPRGSLMEHHPCFQRLMGMMSIHRKFVKMGDFAAESEKGTWLYSSSLPAGK